MCKNGRTAQYIKIEHNTNTVHYKSCHIEHEVSNEPCLTRHESIMG